MLNIKVSHMMTNVPTSFESENPVVVQLVKYFKFLAYVLLIFGIDIRVDLYVSSGTLLNTLAPPPPPKQCSFGSFLRITYNVLAIIALMFGLVLVYNRFFVLFLVSKIDIEKNATTALRTVTSTCNIIIFFRLLWNQDALSQLASKFIFEIGCLISCSKHSKKNLRMVQIALSSCLMYFFCLCSYKTWHAYEVIAVEPDVHQCLGIELLLRMCPKLVVINAMEYICCVFLFLHSFCLMAFMFMLLFMINVNLDILNQNKYHITHDNVSSTGLGQFIHQHRLACRRISTWRTQTEFKSLVS